jgi:hypothetical protein
METLMATLIIFFTKNTLIIFIIAFAAGMIARTMVNKGQLKKAKILATVAFGAASLLAVIYLGIGFITKDWVNLLFAALWGYFAFRDYKLMQLISGR